VKVENLGRLQAKLGAARTGGIRGCGRGVRLAGEDLLSRSIPVTPKRTGALRESGNVQPQSGVFDSLTRPAVTVGFNVDYALAVHEMPEDTNWTTPGTGPKYLSTPLAENRSRYLEFIREETRKGLWSF
jgi:hypothetical protein